MTITYAVESIDQWYDDIQALLPTHWLEVAVNADIPLDPDWPFYRQADAMGALATYTARDEGRLIGYALFFVRKRHHHYAVGWAINDIVWLAPEYRRQGVASALMDLAEHNLKNRGVAVVLINTKTAHPGLAIMLQSRGYRHTEDGFSTRL